MYRTQVYCLLALSALVAQRASAESAEQIKRSPKLPATTPWDLKALSAPPKFKWENAAGPVRSLFYEGEPYRGKPTRVFAYYATPGSLAGDTSQDKMLPAVILIHGGGGTAFRQWAELWAKRGYAAIAMDLAGHRPIEGENALRRENRTRLADGGPDQGVAEKFESIDEPPSEQWSYHAVAAAIRAHSLIRSFPEIDARRTAVTGISWGGYLTSIVASIDNRFSAAVPVYGCGFLHENSAWLSQFSRMNDQQRDRWVALWDPSRYLPATTMPLLFINGTNDNAYPLDSYMKSVAVAGSPKQIRITVKMRHSHLAGWAPQEIGLFIDHRLKAGKPLPIVGEPKVEDGRVTLPVASDVQLAKAELHYATGEGPINRHEWETRPAMIEINQVIALLPARDTPAWFITVTDERGAIVSSRVVMGE